MDLDAYERRFRSAGLPMLVEDRTAREDVWTRASPVLGFVLIVEALLAVNREWPLWANALVLVGAVAALAAAGALVNALRGRPALALPEDVGAIELAVFVAIGGLLQLIGGQTNSAWVVCAVNVGLLLVLYVWFAYGVASILRFTGRRVGVQLAAAVDLLARAIPLLLLFSIVLFVNTEMWQVFAAMNTATVVATAALLAVVGSVFLGVRLPREVQRIERDVAAEPPLRRRQRINVGLVLFVTQALQIVLVALAVGAFFMAFGALVIPADVIESWTGTRGRQILFLDLGDIDVRVTVELLRVSAGIAALSGLYYSVAVLTDSTYREEFLEELTGDLRAVFADRARYLELRDKRQARDAPSRHGGTRTRARYGPRMAQPIVITPGTGTRVGNVEFLALSEHTAHFNLSIITMAPGREGPSAHAHDDEDDAFYILDGELRFVVDDREIAAPAGTFVLIPPGVVHTFMNPTAAPVRVLNIHAPAGFDRRLLA